MNKEDFEFDYTFHLCGFQRLPAYWGLRQHKSRKHVLIASDAVDVDVYNLFIHPFDVKVVRVDPFDPRRICDSMLEFIATLPADSRLAFNLTAGTKLMFQAMMDVWRAAGGYAYYFTTDTYSELDLSTYKLVRPIAPVKSVETFLRLNTLDCKVTEKGRWGDHPGRNAPERRRLCEFLRKRAKGLRHLYKLLSAAFDENGVGFSVRDKGRTNIDVRLYPNGNAIVTAGDEVFSFDFFPDIAKYVRGGWLEEYVFLQLRPLINEGLIHDLRINTVITFTDSDDRYKAETPYNEFDLLFTDGTRLYIIECKAGSISSEHVVKLQNLTRNLGGLIGQGIMVSPFKPYSATGKRLKEAKECRYSNIDGLRDKVRAMILQDRAGQKIWENGIEAKTASREGFVRTVLVFRAVPGSGKTTFSNRIRDAVTGAGLTIAVHSTDAYFINPVTHAYDFDAEKLPEYHKRNLDEFRASLAAGVDVVAVDTTNLRPWETEPYTRLARDAGYRIVFFNFAPREIEKHLAAQQVTPDRPDAHKVPRDVLERFIEYFHQYNVLFDHGAEPHPELVYFRWDEQQKKAVPTDIPAKPFDYDDKLDISPTEYHTLKDVIGDMMINRFLRA